MTHVLVCGGREFGPYSHVHEVLDRLHAEHGFGMVIHGSAGIRNSRNVAIKGADILADRWAEARGIQRVAVPANWNGLGTKAGMARNSLMLELFPRIGLVVAFPGGPGTSNMLMQAFKRKIPLILTEDLAGQT